MATTGSVSLALPAPTLSAIGAVGTAQVSGKVTLTLPKPKLSGAGSALPVPNVTLALPTPTLAVKGYVTAVAVVDAKLPVLKFASTGDVSLVGTVSLTLPTPRLTSHNGSAAVLQMPAPRLASTARTGILGNVQLVMPQLVADSAGAQPAAAAAPLVLPTPQLGITGKVGNIASVANALRGIALTIEGATGVVGHCSLTLPARAIAIGGGPVATGSVTLVLPLLVLQGTGQAASVVAPDANALSALVMNTQTSALSQYANFPFNSMTVFGDAYLGASAEGLFVIAQGNLDNTTVIDAIARLNTTDFGTSFEKRIDRCYVGYRADGNMTLRVYTDEVNVRDYLIEAYGKNGIHGNHTRIGKGLSARYWQFELRNNNGADFELNALELKATQLRRRIGGGDA